MESAVRKTSIHERLTLSNSRARVSLIQDNAIKYNEYLREKFEPKNDDEKKK